MMVWRLFKSVSRRQVLKTLLASCTPFLGIKSFDSASSAESIADVRLLPNTWRPRGPSRCFRQFNLDWSWIALRPEEITEFFRETSPAAIAEFLARSHVDGTVVMAVPHHGYCTHNTKAGERFPSLTYDWFGAMVDELHRREISAFGYVTLNWNWKYIREHLGADYVHGQPDTDGICGSRVMLCLNASGYLELVEAYTAEVMSQYAIDGMRWDILKTVRGCRCSGCQALYRELFGEAFPAAESLPEDLLDRLYDETISRVVRRLKRLCKSIRSDVEIWQNHLNPYFGNPLHLSRELDLAYNEFGDAFRLLVIKGVSRRPAVINGLMNQSPTEPPQAINRSEWRLCLLLGGRCYSYYGHRHTDPRTLLPDESIRRWHREQLAPFYQMVRDIQPWLENAQPVTDINVLFSEATKLRFPGRDRTAYLRQIEPWVTLAIEHGRPPEFTDVLDLPNGDLLAEKWPLLIVPLTSGLTESQLLQLRNYIRAGGTLLVIGDALRHDPDGKPLDNFALAREMGLDWLGEFPSTDKFQLEYVGPQGLQLDISSFAVKTLAHARPIAGQTWLWAKTPDQKKLPLLHLNPVGRGRCAWLATIQPPELVYAIIEFLGGEPPLKLESPMSRAILTFQPDRDRWIVHFLTDDAVIVRLSRRYVHAKRIVARYPATGWQVDYRADDHGIYLVASDGATDRLVVLGR